MRDKCRRYRWARESLAAIQAATDPWVTIPMDRLRQLLPKKRTNVYHCFTCPVDHSTLTFDPFNDKDFRCPQCRRSCPPDGASNVYPPDSPYHGTYYDGWGCLFIRNMSYRANCMGVVYSITGDDRYAKRAADILLMMADLIGTLPTSTVAGYPVIFTYALEGDALTLLEFATAYDLVRVSKSLSTGDRSRIEQGFIKPFCDRTVRAASYGTMFNNLWWWDLALMQVGVNLEDRDYIDLAFGHRQYSPASDPGRKSLANRLQHYFRPDGASYELCSGYHLYALMPMLKCAIVGRNLSRHQPAQFPSREYDLTDPRTSGGAVAQRAIRWYLSIALPDYTMAQIGDSMWYRDSLQVYSPCADMAYRYFGVNEVAYYPGSGPTVAASVDLWRLVYGVGEMRRKPVGYRSSRLSSGYCALRNDYRGNRVYAGLNYLRAGASHQHADRLELITYAYDHLLGFEKGNPYNDAAVGQAGRQSYSHNTVVVDGQSQKPGGSLSGAEVPSIRYFQSNGEMEFAEVVGDRIHPQTSRYRRLTAILDDTIVDLFDVKGGRTHDWIYHCDGSMATSLPMADRESFEPSTYVVGGSPRFRSASTRDAWTATWQVDGKPGASDDLAFPYRNRTVYHRLTMLGGVETQVMALKTYPAQKPLAERSEYTDTIVARRDRQDAPFVAVFDSYLDKPRTGATSLLDTDVQGGVAIRLGCTESERLVLYNPRDDTPMAADYGGTRVQFVGHFAVLRIKDGRLAGASMVGATALTFGDTRIETERAANTLVTRDRRGRLAATTSADLQYETVDGKSVPAPHRAAPVRISEDRQRR